VSSRSPAVKYLLGPAERTRTHRCPHTGILLELSYVDAALLGGGLAALSL
jgi:hypothetical protein